MDGMTMMLKSMGIDPDKIKEQFQETAAQVMAKVDAIQASHARIETKFDLLLSVLRESGGNMDSIPPQVDVSETFSHIEQGAIDG